MVNSPGPLQGEHVSETRSQGTDSRTFRVRMFKGMGQQVSKLWAQVIAMGDRFLWIKMASRGLIPNCR